MKYKLEIVDNQIKGYYEYVLYSWKKKNWWSKEKWNMEFSHTLGHRYMCPEIHQGKITAKEYFERDVQLILKGREIIEIHKTTITKN
jgi:hypothetical protein